MLPDILFIANCQQSAQNNSLENSLGVWQDSKKAQRELLNGLAIQNPGNGHANIQV